MARARRDEFGTPFGQEGSAAANRLGTPFGQATPKPVQSSSTFTYGQGNPLSNVYVPPVANVPPAPQEKRYSPGDFRRAEDTSNVTGPIVQTTYTTDISDGDGNDGGDDNLTDDNTGDVKLVSTETDEYGNVIGFFSDGTSKILIKSGRTTKTTVDEDAYALLEQTFKDYGLDELVPVIKGYMDRNLGSNQAALELRKEPAYQARFAGNEIRRKVGLNVLSEAEYLNLENAYSETLRSYGLQNYFGIDRKLKQKAMGDIIGNDISAVEFKDRIDTVVTRVTNSDPSIKTTLKSFYNITDDDLVSYFLNPKENLPKLQEKVTSAEIGAAATAQGLKTSADAATALAQFGVTKQQAQEGYQAIGSILPTATKLGEIYQDTYTQDTAEQEVFRGAASAQRKRQKLVALEEAQFGGSSGRMRTGKAQTNTGQF